MNIKKIRQRWEGGELALFRENIFNAIKEKESLSSCGGVVYFDGKIDLRGLEFPKPEEVVEVRSYPFLKNAFLVEDYGFENVDFSYSDLSYIRWSDASIENCLFDTVNFSNSKLDNCIIIDSEFNNCNFKNASLERPTRKGDGVIRRVSFTACDFSKVLFQHPEIENCIFKDCKFLDTDFNGSRLSNCSFQGEIKNAWFRGHLWQPKKKSFLDRIFTNRQISGKSNKMLHVDFSEAWFGEVFFNNGIDLSTCVFPVQDNYLKISGIGELYRNVRERINAEWDSPYKERALSVIDKILYDEEKKGMDIDFIYLDFPFVNVPGDFSRKLFNMINEVNKHNIE